jgi:hypothetical protein
MKCLPIIHREPSFICMALALIGLLLIAVPLAIGWVLVGGEK